MSETVAGEQTTMYRGNLQNTGVYGTRAARTFRDEPNWVYQTGSDITSPLVVGDGTLFFVTDSGVIHAVDATTGDENWLFNSGSDVYNSPAVGHGVVLLTTADHKRLIALDARRGQPVPMNLERNDDFCSPPKIVDNLVIMGGFDTLYGIQIPEFQLRWSVPAYAGCCLFSCPAVADGIAYFAAERATIAGLDLRIGEAVIYELGGAGGGLFTVHDPVVHDEVLYVFVSESDDPLLDLAPPSRTLLALRTGGIGEMHMQEVAPMFVTTSQAVSESTLCFGCGDGALYAMDLDNWHLRRLFQTGDCVASSPSIAEGLGHPLRGLIYFGSDDGNLYVLNKDTGELVRSFATPSGKPVRTSPVLWGGAVYFGDTDGNVYSWGRAADLPGIP